MSDTHIFYFQASHAIPVNGFLWYAAFGCVNISHPKGVHRFSDYIRSGTQNSEKTASDSSIIQILEVMATKNLPTHNQSFRNKITWQKSRFLSYYLRTFDRWFT